MKTPTESWLSPLILRYLDLKKALGRGFAVERRVLETLGDFVAEHRRRRSDPKRIRALVQNPNPLDPRCSTQSDAYRAQLLLISSPHRTELLRP